MSTAAFLLAPACPIRSELTEDWVSLYSSWNYLTHIAWEDLRLALPEEERGPLRLRGAFGEGRFSSNFAACGHLDSAELRKSAEAWVRDRFRAWAEAGYPDPAPSNGPAEFAEATGLESEVSLPLLVGYRSGFRPIPKRRLRGGVGVGFINHHSGLNELTLGEHHRFELRALEEIARTSGGEHLAVWTFGEAIHHWHARAEAPGVRPVLFGESSVRVVRPHAGRDPRPLAALLRKLEGSVFEPDREALEAELVKPRVSIAGWFDAFGIADARELVPAEREGTWAAFDRVASALLRGDVPQKDDRTRVNALLRETSAAVLPGKSPKRREKLSRAIAEAAYELREGLGASEDGLWTARVEAAGHYWDITDCPAGDLLTVGIDRAGHGTAASLLRLLTHFPAALARDHVFLALAALQAEAANGHFFVEPLEALAAHVHAVGYTLAVFPADQREAFRRAFGIEQPAGPTESQADSAAQGASGWAAEAFVDLPGIVRRDPLPALLDWFEREGSDGQVLRAEGDGRTTRTVFGEAHAMAEDGEALAEAARALDPRAALIALGLPDLLAPGAWTPGAYAGEAGDVAPERAWARRVLAAVSDADADTEDSWVGLRRRLGRSLLYRGDRSPDEGGIVSVRIVPHAADEETLRSVRTDLQGEGHVGSDGGAWVENGAVLAFTSGVLDVDLLIRTLADLPAGTAVAVAVGGDLRASLRLGPAGS